MKVTSPESELLFLAGGGMMGELTRQKDWNNTAVGSPESWPQSLRTSLSIVLNSGFPMFLWWGPELICFYNDAYRPSLGENGKHPSILGMKGEDAWPEIWPIIKPLIDKVLYHSESVYLEDQLIPIHRNGKLEDVYWTFSYSPVNDESGSVAGVLVTCNETTEKVKALKKVEESEERFRTMAECTNVMIAMSDETANATYFNSAWEKLTGRPVKQLLDFGWADLIHTEDRDQFVNIYLSAFEKRIGWSGEFRILNKDGNYSAVLATGAPRFHTDGSFLGYVGSCFEITDLNASKEKLKESEKRFRKVADSAPVLIWMSDTKMSSTYFNTAWLNFRGRTLEQEIGDGWKEAVHPDDAYICHEANLKAFQNREEFYVEYRLRRHDGEYRWVSEKGVPRFTSEGIFEGFIGACMDIHERIVYENKLREDDEKLNIVIQASELGTWELDLKANKINYSKRYLEILGFPGNANPTHAELISRIHPEDLVIRSEALKRSFETGFLLYEARLIWEDNSIHWMEGRGKVFYDENNKPAKLLGTIRDITDEKNYQQQLIDREQKFRLLADSMPQHIWTADIDGRINYYNKSITEYTGISQERLFKEGWLQIIHPDDKEENMMRWEESIKTGKDYLFEHRFRRFDGVYRWQLSRAIPQKDSEGNIRMWVGTSTDIQDQKMFSRELERQVQERTTELEQKNIDLEKMNKELQSFAYISSHDLQEPLRKIQTFSTRIVEKEFDKLSENGKDSFQRIQNAARRMQTLIEDLLAYSRTNTAERIFEYSDLNLIVEEIKEEFKDELIQKNGKIEIGEMCSIKIIPFQFRQLIHNLIGNSIKFAKENVPPLIKIESKIESEEELNFDKLIKGANYCHISISDNGIGFDQKYKDRIFELFQRLHGRNEYNGTGIGLAIVKKIVENHNGFITSNGEVNVGARFDIYLPVD